MGFGVWGLGFRVSIRVQVALGLLRVCEGLEEQHLTSRLGAMSLKPALTHSDFPHDVHHP